MQVCFLRHGQTDWNRAGRWQSRSEVPLNETGWAQSRAVAKLILDECAAWQRLPQAVICSPMGRAQSTAGEVASALGVNVVVEPAFIELDLGEYEGRLHSDLLSDKGAGFTEWFAGLHRVAPPGGESLAEGMRRAAPALDAHLDSAYETGAPLIIVAHQGVNMALKTLLAGYSAQSVPEEELKRYKQSNSEVDIWEKGRAPDRGLQRGVFVRRRTVDESHLG